MEGRKVKCRMCMQEGSCEGGKDTKAVGEGRVSQTRGGQVREAIPCGREEWGALGRGYLNKVVL